MFDLQGAYSKEYSWSKQCPWDRMQSKNAKTVQYNTINSCTKWVFSGIDQYEFSVSSEVFVCTRPMVKCITVLKRTLSWQFLKRITLDGESEQRTTTGPQISANESLNIEPSFQLLLLLTPKIGRTSISWQAGQAGWARSRTLPY